MQLMSEVSDDDNWDDGIPVIPDDLYVDMPKRGLLARVVKSDAITLQQAADLFGMSTRQFKRLLGGPHFPDTDNGVMNLGSSVFYDKSIVSIYVKKYRVGRFRLSLRKKGLSKDRRKKLGANLKR